MQENDAVQTLWASLSDLDVDDDIPTQSVVIREDDELADLLADPGTGPDSYIRQAQILAQHELGMLPDDATDDDALEYGGALDYVMALQLCKMAQRPILGLRKHVYKVMVTGSWAHTPLASTDGKRTVDAGSGEIKQAYFQSFDEWFSAVADASQLNDDYRYTTLNGVTKLLPTVVTQGITIEMPSDEDETVMVTRPVELDELLNMDQSKFSKIVSGTHNLWRDANGTEGDQKTDAVSKIGRAIGAGLKGSKRALDKVLVDIGTRAKRAPAQGFRFALPGGGYGYMVLPATDAQDKSFNVGVDGRVEFANTTLAGIVEKCNDLNSVTQA